MFGFRFHTSDNAALGSYASVIENKDGDALEQLLSDDYKFFIQRFEFTSVECHIPFHSVSIGREFWPRQGSSMKS